MIDLLQWFLGKSCDTFCPMGPWIVPASEINGQDLTIQCWVNDELRQVWYPHTPEQTNCIVKSSFVLFLMWGICEDLTHPSSSQVDNFAYCQIITWMLCFNCFLGEVANLQKLPAQGPIDILNTFRYDFVREILHMLCSFTWFSLRCHYLEVVPEWEPIDIYICAGLFCQDGRTFEMIFLIAELISTISAGITLHTGDILATGTSAGEYHECGWGRQSLKSMMLCSWICTWGLCWSSKLVRHSLNSDGCLSTHLQTSTHYIFDLNRCWIWLQSSTPPQARGHHSHQGGRNWRAA